MRIVQCRRTDTHRHVSLTAVYTGVGNQRSVRSRQHNRGLVVNRVADVVGRRVALRQVRGGAFQFALHHFHYGICSVVDRGVRGDARRLYQQRCHS